MAKLTVDAHKVKRVHVIPLDEAGEHEEHRREPDAKRVKGPLHQSTLTLLEKQGLQALLTLHSDMRPLHRQDVDTREDMASMKEMRDMDSFSADLVSNKQALYKPKYASKTKLTEKSTTRIRFLGDPLAIPNPPPFIGRPLALPPPLPRIPYGVALPAKTEPRPDKTSSQSADKC